MHEEERMTRRRFLKAMGLGLAGLSMTEYLTYVFGGSSVSDVLKAAVGSKRLNTLIH